jgi:PIN domain nuclease of toxin-antitoxin system
VILLDTQVVLWLMSDRLRLSTHAAEAIRKERQGRDGISIASSTLWEIAITLTRGRIELRGTLAEYLDRVESTFLVLPITGSIAARSMLFTSQYPRDPMDRIIGATSVVHGLKLVTADKEIRASGEVDCIW